MQGTLLWVWVCQTASELSRTNVWLNGPSWLHRKAFSAISQFDEDTVPEECSAEMKRTATKSTHILLVSATSKRIGILIDCKRYGSFHKLLRVTSLVIKFALLLKGRIHSNTSIRDQPSTVPTVDRARTLWIREIQELLPSNPRFLSWQRQFGLYLDDSNVWRCKG